MAFIVPSKPYFSPSSEESVPRQKIPGANPAIIKQVVKGVEDIFKQIGLQDMNGLHITEREREHFVHMGRVFDNWKKGQDKMKEHEKSQTHRDAECAMERSNLSIASTITSLKLQNPDAWFNFAYYENFSATLNKMGLIVDSGCENLSFL